MCPHFTTSRFIKIRKWIQHMTFSMKDGSSSDNYPDKSSRRVRHGKGGCTSKRKKGGCVARTPVSTSPAARLLCTARCTLSSSTLHALSFGGGDTPGIEVLSRQGFRQDASPRGVSLTSLPSLPCD